MRSQAGTVKGLLSKSPSFSGLRARLRRFSIRTVGKVNGFAMTRMLGISAMVALCAGCFSSEYNARVFHPWGCDGAKELKARLDEYTNILMVCIYEDHWEDRGPNRYALHHYKGTVVRVYKGDWRMSDRIAFVQGLDYRAPMNPATCVGYLAFLFTSEHTNSEIGLDTGDLTRCNAEYAPALDRIYAQRRP
jgi:hypothetical protein